MEGLLNNTLGELARQGTGWLLFVIAAVAGALFYRRVTMQITSERATRDALQEKRVVEARETIITLHEGAQANLRMATALEEQSASRQALVSLVTQMQRDQERDKVHWQSEVTRIQVTLQEILKEIRDQNRRGQS